MTDGTASVTDLLKTEHNRETVRNFVSKVLIDNEQSLFEQYIDLQNYIEHHPNISDSFPNLYDSSSSGLKGSNSLKQYSKIHRILAEGNFVLCVCEGQLDAVQSSFFDLYRLEGNKIVEHWDTIEKIPERSLWKNDNGKF